MTAFAIQHPNGQTQLCTDQHPRLRQANGTTTSQHPPSPFLCPPLIRVITQEVSPTSTKAKPWSTRRENSFYLRRGVAVSGREWLRVVAWRLLARRDEKLVAVVDWEDAVCGEPLYGFAMSRMDLLMAFGLEAMHTFTHTYHTITEFDLTYLPYWDLLATIRPAFYLAKWAEGWANLGHPDVTETTMYQDHHWFVNHALQKICS